MRRLFSNNGVISGLFLLIIAIKSVDAKVMFQENFENDSLSFFSMEIKGFKTKSVNESKAAFFTFSDEGYFRYKLPFPTHSAFGMTITPDIDSIHFGECNTSFIRIEQYDTTKTPYVPFTVFSCSLSVEKSGIINLILTNFGKTVLLPSIKNRKPTNIAIEVVQRGATEQTFSILHDFKRVGQFSFDGKYSSFSIITIGNIVNTSKRENFSGIAVDNILVADSISTLSESTQPPVPVIGDTNTPFPVFSSERVSIDSIMTIVISADSDFQNIVLYKELLLRNHEDYRMEFPLKEGVYFTRQRYIKKTGLVSDWCKPASFSIEHDVPFTEPVSITYASIVDEATGDTVTTITPLRSYILQVGVSNIDKGFAIMQLHHKGYTLGTPHSKGGYFDRTKNYIFNFSIGGTPWIYASREDVKGRSIRVSGQRYLYIDDQDSFFTVDAGTKMTRVRFSLLSEAKPGEWYLSGFMEGNNSKERSYLFRKAIKVISGEEFIINQKIEKKRTIFLAIRTGIMLVAILTIMLMTRRIKRKNTGKSDKTLLEIVRTDGLFINIKEHKHRHIVQRAEAFVLENISRNISPADVASHLNMTTTWIGIVFKEATGMTMVHFINRMKIDKAIELFKNGNLSATDIAMSVGFSSLDHFRRVFKEETGKTPKEFRAGIMK